jgi:glycosyltransferase involved in cell wall biosynthesis
MTEHLRILCIDNIAVETAKRTFYRAVAATRAYEVHLLVPETWQEQGDVIAAEPEPDPLLHVHTTPILFGHRQHRVIHRGLVALLRELRPALLYVDSEPENYTSAYARWAIRHASPSTKLALVSCRNIDYRTTGFPYKVAFTHRWCDDWFIRTPADLLFSRPLAGLPLLRHYARTVVQMPYVIDTGVFSPEGVKTFTASGVTIGYLGRLVESKGIGLLMDAMSSLPGECHLLMAGKGPMREELENRARRLGINSRTKILPSVPYGQVPALLRSMDILVLPSLEARYWTEQFGRVLIEAMACGVPVVASKSGEIPEVLGPAGLLVPSGDRAALTEALLALVGDPGSRNRLSAAGRARVLETYDARAVAARFLEVVRVALLPPMSV